MLAILTRKLKSKKGQQKEMVLLHPMQSIQYAVPGQENSSQEHPWPTPTSPAVSPL